MIDEINKLTPQELIDEIRQREYYDDDEKAVAQGMQSQLTTIGITGKQLAYLRSIVTETRMYLDGYCPVDIEDI